jgi:hypothetical protein
MMVVDDSPEVDHEIFNMEETGSAEWVLISDEVPLDENKRDDLIERFQLRHQPGGGPLGEDEPDLDDDDEEEDEEEDDDEDDYDELDGVDDLEFDRE